MYINTDDFTMDNITDRSMMPEGIIAIKYLWC